jgi:AraC-like DNA-binding protein
MVENSFAAHRTLRAGVVRVEATLADFAFPPHSHDHVCIGLVRDGAHDCRYGLRRHTVERGDLMLVNPGEVHDGRPTGRVGRRYSMLEIDHGAFRALCLDGIELERLEFQRSVSRVPTLRDALADWLICLAGTDASAEHEAAAVFFGSALELADRSAPPSTGGLATRVYRRMREGDLSDDSIADLAKESGVSRYTLIRAFKQAFGLTPEDVRRQLRVERARTLLAGPGGLVEIAVAAGFADQSHMTRELRRLTGMSPAAYRRALR